MHCIFLCSVWIRSVRYCIVFSFIFLLYCGSHECVYIYISLICNVEVLFFVNIIKLGILSFLSSHGIRAKGKI